MIELFHLTKDCSNCVFHSKNMKKAKREDNCCIYKLHHKIHPPEGEEVEQDIFNLILCNNYDLSLNFIPKYYYLREPDDLRNLYKKCAIHFNKSVTTFNADNYIYPSLAIIKTSKLELNKSINESIIIISMIDMLNYESPKDEGK